MGVRLSCSDYGFECDFMIEGKKSPDLVRRLKAHFEDMHGIEYTYDAVIQMLINRGHSKDSFER